MAPRPQPTGFDVAEFFAGIGLVGHALERVGGHVAWANDIEPVKAAVYRENFDPSTYRLDDIRRVRGADLPSVALATASFPCTDLSLAGYRRGLQGEQSGMFWEFARVLSEMGRRRPATVMLENVPGFATSRNGSDVRSALSELNRLGYSCDLFQIDAARFVPQSRPRMFIVGARSAARLPRTTSPDWARPNSILRIYEANRDLRLHRLPLPAPPQRAHGLSEIVERFNQRSPVWWTPDRAEAFISSLSPLHMERLRSLSSSQRLTWRTAYRRTRNGVATWEIRRDDLAGCLRTARGGSSKQAVVEAGRGRVGIRWMTAREYARLQGAPDDFSFDSVSSTQAMFGFGDAVCIPVIEWIAENYLTALAVGTPRGRVDLSA